MGCNGLVPTSEPSNESRAASTSIYFNLVLDVCLRQSDDAYSLSLFLRRIMSVPVLAYKISDADLRKAWSIVSVAAPATLKMLSLYNRAPISALLPVYSVSEIPVPATLALFGNLVAAFRLSEDGEGERDGDVFLLSLAPFLTLLLSELPLSTFSTKAAVAWVKVSTATPRISKQADWHSVWAQRGYNQACSGLNSLR